MPNRLAKETSPYLLQHAANPVDWYPWGPEALERAKLENLPIFLSIGYAACHWCHVMERESFADPGVAAFMNANYVCIKVDREERPDLDSIYMQAVVAFTGRGGWPMSVWLTPAGEPFYGGTYFPPTPRYGMPSFAQVLEILAQMWKEQKETLLQNAAQTTERLRRATASTPAEGDAREAETNRPIILDPDTLARAAADLVAGRDRLHGGWGDAPKFPQPMVIEFLLHHAARTGEGAAAAAAAEALTAMARGGIYDHLGGGFHRYSTDEAWLVPHFEKMLYDNAQLARAYLHAWQLTGDPHFRQICEETLDYVLRDMTDPAGGFYSTEDADSEGEEGKYYVWTPDEIRLALGESQTDQTNLVPDAAQTFLRVYGVDDQGNFEGRNVLHVASDPAAAEDHSTIAHARRVLLEARDQRPRPARDDKVLASWNGLTLSALAEAGAALGRSDYVAAAEKNAAFVLTNLRAPDGRLLRTWRAGRARLGGYLEDYAALCEGLVCLYHATFAERWVLAATSLADIMLARFRGEQGEFYDTADDHELLLVRPRDLQDNAIPSGGSLAVTALARLAALTGAEEYRVAAEKALAGLGDLPYRYPLGFGQWLWAAELMVEPPEEIVVVGPSRDDRTEALIKTAREGLRPGRVIAHSERGATSALPLFEGRSPADDAPLAWVCRGATCLAPVKDEAELRRILRAKA